MDASAFVAIIAREDGFEGLAAALEGEAEIYCSAISIWETVAALVRSYQYSVPDARRVVSNYIGDLGFKYVPMGQRENDLALDAFGRFGRGRHKAALNMGDCFAYACAKANSAKLLFKGGDFALTDIDAA
jgi:ribonuclease VapC